MYNKVPSWKDSKKFEGFATLLLTGRTHYPYMRKPTATLPLAALETRSSRDSRGENNLKDRPRSFRAKTVRRFLLCCVRLVVQRMRCLTFKSEERETWTADVLADTPSQETVVSVMRHTDGHVF